MDNSKELKRLEKLYDNLDFAISKAMNSIKANEDHSNAKKYNHNLGNGSSADAILMGENTVTFLFFIPAIKRENIKVFLEPDLHNKSSVDLIIKIEPLFKNLPPQCKFLSGDKNAIYKPVTKKETLTKNFDFENIKIDLENGMLSVEIGLQKPNKESETETVKQQVFKF